MVIWGCLLHSEPLNEEGDVDGEYAHGKDGKFMCWTWLIISLRLRWYHWIEWKNASMWCATELETGSSAANSTSSSAAPPQKRAERPRANSSGSVDQNRLTGGPAGGGIASGGKLMPQIPVGPQCKQRPVPSPGFVRREWVSQHVAASQLTCCICVRNEYYVFWCLFFCIQIPGTVIYGGYCSSRQGLFFVWFCFFLI